MKDWKKKKQEMWLDVEYRDYPSIFLNDTLYIGNKGSSHATMVQEIFHGMNFEEDYLDMYQVIWDEDCKEIPLDERTHTVYYNRARVEDEDNYVFGHVVGNVIYWDTYMADEESVENLKLHMSKDKKYKHYALNEQREVIELRKYRV